MTNKIEPTPAQREFLKASIDGFSTAAWRVELAGQAGSQRRFFRVEGPVKSERRYILVVWDSRDEDWGRFLGIEADLRPFVPFLPKIYSRDERHGLILEEDLGATTLKQFCVEHRDDPGAVERMYEKVLDSLCAWQSLDISASPIISSRAMDLEVFLWETNYFARHCVTEFCGCERLLGTAWERERTRLGTETASLRRTCIHRDFQSENILIAEGAIRFVDYQGARLGPPEYDVASLLYDPYIEMIGGETAGRLHQYYRGRMPSGEPGARSFYLCATQRLMQALGAYGNLSIHKGKGWYRGFIPLALERLHGVVEHLDGFPQIKHVVENCRNACRSGQIPV